MTLDIDIRTLAPDDVPTWLRAVSTGFLGGPDVPDEEIEVRRLGMDVERTQGAFDGDRCVGTFRTTPQEMTVPGGATLPSCAVTNVTVSPTHRRRRLLSRMMAGALTAAKERGDAFASLIAAEYPIYGRYGFGPASWTTDYEVDLTRARLDPRYAGPAEGEGRVDFADAEEIRRVGPELHERFRAQPHRQGTIDRSDYWWRVNTGALRWPGDGYVTRFHAVHRDAEGVPQGAVAYTTGNAWQAKLPRGAVNVDWLTACTPAAERALWRFVLSVDWVTTVRSGHRAPDDVLPLLLPDPRAARIDIHADFLWLRPLDVPRMLRARTYPVPGTLVLELHDAVGLAGGRFRLEAKEAGATCEVTREEPDLSMDIGELATLYLGDESATRLTTLDRVREHTTGAATTADALLRTSRRPWCPDVF